MAVLPSKDSSNYKNFDRKGLLHNKVVLVLEGQHYILGEDELNLQQHHQQGLQVKKEKEIGGHYKG